MVESGCIRRMVDGVDLPVDDCEYGLLPSSETMADICESMDLDSTGAMVALSVHH